MTVEQGTILDRIDYNVVVSKQQVEIGNVHIENALVIERSSRAINC